jgi:hypothetical protein
MKRITPSHGLWRAFATFLAFATLLPPTLTASPAMEKLFYILKQKGSITADEYDLLMQTMKDEERNEPKVAKTTCFPGHRKSAWSRPNRRSRTSNRRS